MIRNCIKLFNKRPCAYFLKTERELVKCTILMRHLTLPNSVTQCNIQNRRFKSGKNLKKDKVSESGSDSNEKETLYEDFDKYTKTLKINVTSLRVDAILKSSLGIARNKIETLFYESKIRLNGEKIQKKSVSVREGDEIDLIKGPDMKNPNFTNVARVEILSIKGNEDSISVKIKRCKSLAVDAYR